MNKSYKIEKLTPSGAIGRNIAPKGKQHKDCKELLFGAISYDNFTYSSSGNEEGSDPAGAGAEAS